MSAAAKRRDEQKRRVRSLTFASERHFVESFLRAVARNSPWGRLSIAREFDYLRGRPDLVALTRGGELLAFEAKLDRWRKALNQAYRNTCFSHRSYVLIPPNVADRALRYSAEFARRGVGICTPRGKRVTVILESPRRIPIEPWLADVAMRRIAVDADRA